MQQSRILKLIDSMPFRLRMAGATISGRILSSLGAFGGILFVAIVTYAVNNEIGSSYMLIAPIGASAVLAFAVPSSPLAQPWSVLGGNCISALIALLIAHFVTSTGVASAVAVGGAILIMTATRSLHPPGGACALVMVLAYHHDQDSLAALFLSLALNSLALVIAAKAFHSLTGRTYPHQALPVTSHGQDEQLLHPDDIRSALADLGEVFDVTSGDLDAIFSRAQEHRSKRLSQLPAWRNAA
ncbi:CBS domain-containing membrane protein [Croceicoccus naphthovorans]|nr:CBS domain-containing membrane protein [Croceicoccus naphthovorans]